MRNHAKAAAKLQKRYPHLTEDQAASIASWRCSLLDEKARTEALNLLESGLTQTEILRQMKRTSHSLIATKYCFPDFAADWRRVQKGIKKKIESYSIQYLLGRVQVVTTEYVAKRDQDGNLATDKAGEPIWMPNKKTVKDIAPPSDLMRLYLQTHVEGWQEKKEDKESEYLPHVELERMRNEIKSVLDAGEISFG
jgi:hypothetical protein